VLGAELFLKIDVLCGDLVFEGRDLLERQRVLDSEAHLVEDMELLASVANQVAVAVENSLAFQEIAALKDQIAAENIYLQEELRTEHNFADIIGETRALKDVLELVRDGWRRPARRC